MELRGRNVLVVGLGKTGEAAADFCLRRGARVTISEKKTAAELGPGLRTWAERGAGLETGGHAAATFLAADLIIPSPGVPPLPELAAAAARGIPVLSEIELAFRFLKGRLVGITGTNGKSTTTTLVHRILKAAGRRAVLAGNIGTPLLSLVDRSHDDHVFVVELSSFQLDYTTTFRVQTAVFLNISRNHLDWHPTFEDYFAAKKKIVARLAPEAAAVLNRDDPAVWALGRETPARVLGFSRLRRPGRGAFVRDGWVVLKDEAERRVLPVREIRLPGLHNLENVLAAAAAAGAEQAPPAAIRAAVRAFRGLEHRLEPVATVRGIAFVNDSKATTVEATRVAIRSFDRPVVLILGGKDKGADFTALRPLVRKRVRRIVLVGAAKDKIRAALEGAAPMDEAATFPEVVPLAYGAARRGDVVLLAPACTSWDMFRSFEERGRLFKREVRKLARREAGRRS